MQFLTNIRATLFLFALLALSGPAASKAEGQGLLYNISKDGELNGYLLGTVHSDDPRLVDFSKDFVDALNSCDSFAMELVPNQPTLSRLMEYMRYQDGSTLESRIGSDRYAKILEAASVYHLGPDQLSTMKVWAAMMTISIPPPENGLFMDLSLALQAAGNGLEVVGLETLDEQLAFMENMPLEQQLILLDQALEDFNSINDFYQELISTYLTMDLQMLQKQSDEQFSELPEDVGDYFFAEGIDARNLRMRDRLVTQLESGRVFAAVGALHLPGDHGLVALLRESGFDVIPVQFSVFND